MNIAWSARCDCYHNHNSNSGRCTCRNSGPPIHKNAFGHAFGVADPTRNKGEVAICESCRANCPAGNGKLNQTA